MASFTPDEIEKQEFLSSIRGYDKEEVRAFLVAVAGELRSLQDRAAGLSQSEEDHSLDDRIDQFLGSAASSVEEMQTAVREETLALQRARMEMEAIHSEVQETMQSLARAAEAQAAAASAPPPATPHKEPTVVLDPDPVPEKRESAPPLRSTRREVQVVTGEADVEVETKSNGSSRDVDETKEPAKPPAQWEELLADPDLDV